MQRVSSHFTQLRVSIVVPCCNERHHIEACIQSIFAQTIPANELEVIVADGQSDDGTLGILAQLVRMHPQLHVIENPQRIVSAGLNTAIRMARGPTILRMDAHTTYAPDYVEQCLQVLQETGVENVGGPLRTRGVRYVERVIAAAFQAPFVVGGARRCDPSYEGLIDTVTYGCWPREVLDRFGGFDEELVRNQDDEYNLRLTRGGGRIWQSPRIVSWYTPRGSLRALWRQQLQFGYWKVRVIQKHKIPASIRHLVPGSFALTLLFLSLTACIWPPAVWPLLGLSGLYGIANIVASTLTAARKGWSLLPLFPLVTACFHFAYGLGFLRGLWSFGVLRQGASQAYMQLSRSSAESPGSPAD
ncbi:glycosyltransferase family 2 protein [Candidatus Entotheonella palauensis]|uniref:glycosyltransferase family 2 protein n=1 Tax=Candidatus Entotheonella palauensis TaxID=93172 RepID=UPI000B7DAE78|nr:glycosyltransferase family 2 protein [Candidatus Entotheonella palauensis]